MMLMKWMHNLSVYGIARCLLMIMFEIVPSEHAREVLRGKTNNGILSHMHLISQRTTAVYIKRIHFMTYCCDLLKIYR